MSATRAPLRLGVLISGRGSNMQAVARACRERRINAEIAIVVADREDAGGLAIARELGLARGTVKSACARALGKLRVAPEFAFVGEERS